MQKLEHWKYKGITWDSFTGVMASMRKIEMKIRPKNYNMNGMISNVCLCERELTFKFFSVVIP